MPLGRDNMQAPERGDTLAENNVSAASGHISRNRDRTRLTRSRDNGRLLLVIERVQQLEPQPASLQAAREFLTHRYIAGAHEHRPTGGVTGRNLLDDRRKL